jgi:hypothetical protein
MSLIKKFTDAVFLKKAMYTVLVLLVLLNIFILPHHPHFALEKIPGFWAIFGAVIAIVLARVAKGAAHTFLGKDVDFYVKNENNPTSSLKEAK